MIKRWNSKVGLMDTVYSLGDFAFGGPKRFDAAGEVIIWPFTKVFNYGENNTTVPDEKVVVWAEKINGFMASARWFNGELLVSTTGTLDSEFATMARDKILEVCRKDFSWVSASSYTLIFEIVHEDDPHIVEQAVGAYLIGARDMYTHRMVTEATLDEFAGRLGFLRPRWGMKRFDAVMAMSKATLTEGYMVRDIETGEFLVKLKSPHYLTKKFLMRMGAGKAQLLVDNPIAFKQTIDEEFYGLVDFIYDNYKNVWASIDAQERRELIEDYFNA